LFVPHREQTLLKLEIKTEIKIILCPGPYLDLNQRSQSSTSSQYTTSTTRSRAGKCDDQVAK